MIDAIAAIFIGFVLIWIGYGAFKVLNNITWED